MHSRHALLGRSAELETLLGELDAATQTGMPRSVLLLGEAGVGKTRLLDELADRAAPESYVLRGRCLSYGEGITFWPMVEAIRTGAGIVDSDDAATALEKIEALAGHAEAGVVDRVGSLMGLARPRSRCREIFWGFRRLLEVLSSRRPVLLLIEDLHWAESTLHDFLESMATCDAGVLILCAARTEVLERRPELAEQQTVRLDRLGADETRNLIESWLGGHVDAVGLERIVEASSGNPLFAQQLVFMLRDEGLLVQDGETWMLASLPSDWMPPTIHALLSARIDRLEREDRTCSIRRRSSGTSSRLPRSPSWPSGVDPERVAARADELTRTQILQTEPERDGIDFRAFHHIFIRDSVYESLLKRQRASLHERFVEWADRVNGDRKVEFEEILGYHLEQAHRFSRSSRLPTTMFGCSGSMRQDVLHRPGGARSCEATCRQRQSCCAARSPCCRPTRWSGSSSHPMRRGADADRGFRGGRGAPRPGRDRRGRTARSGLSGRCANRAAADQAPLGRRG